MFFCSVVSLIVITLCGTPTPLLLCLSSSRVFKNVSKVLQKYELKTAKVYHRFKGLANVCKV